MDKLPHATKIALETLRKELWELLDNVPLQVSNVFAIIEMLQEIERLLEWIERNLS